MITTNFLRSPECPASSTCSLLHENERPVPLLYGGWQGAHALYVVISSWRCGSDFDSHGSAASGRLLFSFGLPWGLAGCLSAFGSLLSFGIGAKGHFFGVMLLIGIVAFHRLLFFRFFLYLVLRHLWTPYRIPSSVLNSVI